MFNFKTFNTITVFLKPNVDMVTQNIADLISSYANKHNMRVDFTEPENLNEKSLFISVGGDGTMLGAMRAVLNYPNATVVGLNTGNLGFLSEELPMDLEHYLDNILNKKDVILEERMVLHGELTIDGNDHFHGVFDTINEFVVTGRSIAAAVITKVFINDDFVTKQLGNGVLVSSSTGSTAMPLSAGGAIVSPTTNIMQIVPLLPHSLTSRPIISTGRDTITIKAKLTERVPVIEVHGDGQVLFSFNKATGDQISFTIMKHDSAVKVWRDKDWNFFNVLASKMKW